MYMLAWMKRKAKRISVCEIYFNVICTILDAVLNKKSRNKRKNHPWVWRQLILQNLINFYMQSLIPIRIHTFAECNTIEIKNETNAIPSNSGHLFIPIDNCFVIKYGQRQWLWLKFERTKPTLAIFRSIIASEFFFIYLNIIFRIQEKRTWRKEFFIKKVNFLTKQKKNNFSIDSKDNKDIGQIIA